MSREEKRRKFSEAVLNTLYPPPSPPSPTPKDDEVPLNIVRQDFELESGSSSTSGGEDENGESETQKLTRAQRKRLRKKKLKEDASRRKQIIGPFLPSTRGDGRTCAPHVRRNASEEPSDQPPQPNQKNKVKQRRKAKKLAREREQR